MTAKHWLRMTAAFILSGIAAWIDHRTPAWYQHWLVIWMAGTAIVLALLAIPSDTKVTKSEDEEK